MVFTISKNQGSGRTVITVTPEEKNTTDKDIIQVLTVEVVDGSTKEVKLIHKKENTDGGDIGLIQLWSGSGVPEGYVLCDGSQVSIAEYPELYKAIGDKYNTASTKAGYISVPDLRGRFVVGYDPSNQDYNTIGNMGGEALVTLTLDQIPPHSHKITFKEEKWGDNGNKRPFPNHTRPDSGYTADTQVTGGGSAHENRPPYFVLAYIIKL